MGWVSAEEYGVVEPDPLAESAAAIIQHLNTDHAEALRRIARHYVREGLDESAMTSVDGFGFYLRLKSDDRVYGRPVTSLREGRNSDAARGVLIEMVRRVRSADKPAL